MTDKNMDEAVEYFDSNDFYEAFGEIDRTIERLVKEHRPVNNMDCSCGAPGAFLSGRKNPLEIPHLRNIYIHQILYAFEKNRKDVIRIDPGEDDPLMPTRSDDDDDELANWRKKQMMYDKYLRGGFSSGGVIGSPRTPPAPSWHRTSTASGIAMTASGGWVAPPGAVPTSGGTPTSKPGLPKKTNTGPAKVAYKKRGK